MIEQAAGASAEALAFLARLERWAGADVSTTPAASHAALLAWLRAEQSAHAANGLLHQLAARALDVAATDLERGAGPADLRAHLVQSCAAERADLAGARAAVARTATGLVAQRGAWIATLGGGSTVTLAVLELQRLDRGPRALVGEGRPRLGGRALAAELARAGVPTWLVVDAALPVLLSQAAGLWLGADAVTDRGAIVTVGGYAAALAAREHSVPVHVLATRRRVLPAATGALRIDEMPPAEVWDDPPPGVRPRNVLADLLPLELVRGVVVEDGVLGPTESATVARERALPEPLGGPPAR